VLPERIGCGTAFAVDAAFREQLGVVAVSAITPALRTTMRSACSMVDSRCAMTMVVRPAHQLFKAPACTFARSASLLEARRDVRFRSRSRNRSLLEQRAVRSPRRWRWAAESATPSSPIRVVENLRASRG